MLTLMRLERFTGLHCLDRVAEKLAYKACRSAIMIGDALNRSQMTQVVRNLANLARPWVNHGGGCRRCGSTHFCYRFVPTDAPRCDYCTKLAVATHRRAALPPPIPPLL